MSTTVEIKGELELYLRHLVDAGLYNNVAEAVRDSIRHLMKEYDKKAPFGGKLIVAMAKHWVAPIR